MITQNQSYTARHFFVDEELREGSDDVKTLRSLYDVKPRQVTDLSLLKEAIQKAIKCYDDVALGELIEQARRLGEKYPWGAQLDNAEEFYY